MALADFFKRKRKSLDSGATATDGDDVSPVAGDLGTNESVRKRQVLLLSIIGGVLGLAALFWIFGDSKSEETAAGDGANGDKVEVSTKDIMNRNLSEQEWMALSEERFTSAEHQLKSVDGQQRRLAELEAEIGSLRGQNTSMQADGQRVVSAYQEENEQLRRQLAERRTAPPPPAAGPAAMYGPNGPQAYERPGSAAGKGALPPAMPGGEVKTIAFQSTKGGTAKPVEAGTTVYTDSVNYLPPNSFASAKVIVGVDASAGVGSQTDPLPVVLRITGPARSVFQNGKLLTTKVEGCLVNGAARGDLSSEKVYVKLQKMTCPQPGGRYAVSEVKGFLAFAGKTGVRGRVVSREGGLVMQAFIAGLAGGFGRGFSANANSVFQGTTVNTDGKRDKLSTSEILEGGFGEGVAQTGDMVSKYLIERAEQYQPVIEMPTGIDVEVVFLEGVYVRN
ncbi:conjugal transfer pilus assembly protein TraB [Sphingomonas zeicaulis]|uniref:TrbI/VirB10 family protein n=1 Tax=Sphingomonas zeicaulis TaxID=1632740 RepID=UPI003D1D3C37